MRAVVLVAAHYIDCVANNGEGGDGPGEGERATGLPESCLLEVDFDASQWIEVLVKTATS